MNSAESLDLVKIKSQLQKELLDELNDLILFDSIQSTNDWALDQCQFPVDLPKACFAEQQLSGRGRNDRVWFSPRAQNIYMSIAYKFAIEPVQLYGLSMVVGVCIVRVLKELGVKAGLKWPNDVYVGSGKIAGILIETRMKPDSGICVVIGVGFNYDMADTSNIQIESQWTDLLKEIDAKVVIDRNIVAGKILNEILSACHQFSITGFEGFREAWLENDLCTGKLLDIIEQGRVVQGEYIGISENGALIASVDGCQKMFYAADVSIRMK